MSIKPGCGSMERQQSHCTHMRTDGNGSAPEALKLCVAAVSLLRYPAALHGPKSEPGIPDGGPVLTAGPSPHSTDRICHTLAEPSSTIAAAHK